VPRGGNCPECGAPVRSTLEGVALEESRREAAADAIRSYAKSFLFGAPIGLLTMGAWLGAPVAVLALVGSFQRFVSLRNAAQAMPSAAGASTLEFQRAERMAKIEMAVGLPAVLILNFFSAAIGGKVLETVVTGLVGAAWLGIMALGMVAGTMLVDALVARVAVEAERPKHVVTILYGAVAALMLGGMLQAAMPGFGVGTLIVLGGASAWAVSCAMLAFQGANVGDEIAAGTRKRALAAPREATDDDAPRVDPKLRARAQRELDDDSPIPMD
jgi:hypothetical protein